MLHVSAQQQATDTADRSRWFTNFLNNKCCSPRLTITDGEKRIMIKCLAEPLQEAVRHVRRC